MKHADKVIERILYLEGIPNLQRLGAVKVGEEPIEMHKLDLTLETEAAARLNKAIALCLDRKDAGTRELLEHLLVAEEDSVEWLEAQLTIVKTSGASGICRNSSAASRPLRIAVRRLTSSARHPKSVGGAQRSRKAREDRRRSASPVAGVRQRARPARLEDARRGGRRSS